MESLLEMLLNSAGPAIVIAVVPVVVAALKKGIVSIPKWLLPVIAAALGPVVDSLLAWLSGIESAGLAAVALGLAGVGLREVYKQIKDAFVVPAE